MKTAILSVGNEIVEGFVVNSNAAYFATKLNEIGIKVNKHLTVIDDESQIIEAVKFLNKDHNLIIVSGGLGPTADDKTKESIAKALDITLRIDDYELQKLKDWFAMRNSPYTENNDKQALFSDIDNILVNANGTANGYYFTKDQITYCVLPGPPHENRVMIDTFVKTLVSDEILERDVYIINIGESSAEAKMNHLYAKYPDVYIGGYIQDYGINYRLKSTNKLKIAECSNELKLIFKDNYLCDSIDPLTDFVQLLIKNNLTISFAESCTAGLAAAAIANIPKASHILHESFVTYSNEAKHKYLDVSWDILNNYGAVSPECAQAMASGLFNKTASDLCISITGIAGPDGGSVEKPIGLVYFAIIYQNKTYNFTQNFIGSRNLIRIRAAKSIIFEAYRILQKTL